MEVEMKGRKIGVYIVFLNINVQNLNYSLFILAS